MLILYSDLTFCFSNSIDSWFFLRPQKIVFLLAAFLIHFTSSVAQEMSGITLSNYGGINTVRLNPSGLLNSRLFYDVNIAAGDVFVENNFVFIHKEDYGLFNFLQKNPEFPSADIPGEGVDYNSGSNLIRGFEQTDVLGPSFSIVLNKQAFGISTRAVTMTSVTDLPEYLGELMFEGFNYEPLHGIPQNHDRFDAASAAWWEIGFSYAREIRKRNFEKWSFGINARRLWGYAGMSLMSYNAEYTVLSDSAMDIRNLDAEIGFGIPLNYDNNEFPDDGRTFKGRGTAFDFGLTFVKMKNVSTSRSYKSYCRYEYEDYIYKIGVSMLDVGGLRFAENARVLRYENVSQDWQQIDTLDFVNTNTLVSDLSEVFYNDPDASTSGDAFTLGLPAAVSIQADYNYYPNWHLSSLVILPLKISNSQLQRPGQVLVSLRYETERFEFALPVSLYDFKKPRIGLSARFYYFTIGTDKLGGFFGFDDFYGMDIYFSAKFHILKGWCGRYKPAPGCKDFDF